MELAVSAGASHTVCLEVYKNEANEAPPTYSSTLYTWGSNEDGQLGHSDSEVGPLYTHVVHAVYPSLEKRAWFPTLAPVKLRKPGYILCPLQRG
jgi:hypothetical protein